MIIRKPPIWILCGVCSTSRILAKSDLGVFRIFGGMHQESDHCEQGPAPNTKHHKGRWLGLRGLMSEESQEYARELLVGNFQNWCEKIH